MTTQANPPPTPPPSPQEKFESWAIVELFGHQKIAGKVRETTVFNGLFMRVDVPSLDGEQAFTRFYHPNSVYSFSPVTEETAIAYVRQHRNAPVDTFDARRLLQNRPVPVSDNGEDYYQEET